MAPPQETQPEPTLPPPPGADLEALAANGNATERPASNFRGLSNVQRWKNKEDLRKIGTVILRGLALLFSFLSFILLVTTIRNHYNFTTISEDLNYVLAIAVITMVYTVVQTGIKADQLRTGKKLVPPEAAALIDFIGDQIIAYLLLSSASAATPNVNANMKLANKINYKSPLVDQTAASISMQFLAFFSMAPATLISGYCLSLQISAS